MEAFTFLSSSRFQGGGIPLSEISEYASLMNLRDVFEFVRIVKLIDNIYLKASQESSNG